MPVLMSETTTVISPHHAVNTYPCTAEIGLRVAATMLGRMEVIFRLDIFGPSSEEVTAARQNACLENLVAAVDHRVVVVEEWEEMDEEAVAP